MMVAGLFLLNVYKPISVGGQLQLRMEVWRMIPILRKEVWRMMRCHPPSPPAPTDPRLPLNAMQVFKLKKSWKGIKRCLDDTRVEMFVRKLTKGWARNVF